MPTQTVSTSAGTGTQGCSIIYNTGQAMIDTGLTIPGTRTAMTGMADQVTYPFHLSMRSGTLSVGSTDQFSGDVRSGVWRTDSKKGGRGHRTAHHPPVLSPALQGPWIWRKSAARYVT